MSAIIDPSAFKEIFPADNLLEEIAHPPILPVLLAVILLKIADPVLLILQIFSPIPPDTLPRRSTLNLFSPSTIASVPKYTEFAVPFCPKTIEDSPLPSINQ